MDYAKESLRLHAEWKGKIEMVTRVPVKTKDDLSLAYTPGVAQPCLEIQKDLDKSYELTRRWNTAAVITDGTAVLGLGDIGPEAGMPVMEGKCVLFKAFGDVDALPLCVKTKDVDAFVETVYNISGSFGGINLEDISAPRCFEIERKLKERCDIPIFHDDQHGTAVITLAGLTNALKVVGKKKEDVRVVTSGAGAAAIAITKLLLSAGFKHITMCDRKGAIYAGREGLNWIKTEMAEVTNLERRAGSIADMLVGADVFIGVSAPNTVTTEMVKTMNKDAIIFACATPTPEIFPDAAKAGGAIVIIFGTALLNYFNILPATVVENVTTFFKPTGAFLDFYIAALITGSILGMNSTLLKKAAARYFPAIFGGIILSFALCMLTATIMGYGTIKALLLIALPIMGGGMGAGAVPLSKIFESSNTMTAAEAISVMTPAVAIGNAISIVFAGIIVKIITSKKWNGQGALMQATSVDPKELEISPEMQAKREKIDVKNLGIGLFVSCSFFAWGFIVAKLWGKLVPSVSIHAYAWMIITVAICKIFNLLPENIEVACYQWFQFIMKNLTTTLLVGIGLCYLSLDTVIESFSLTYLVLCLVTCVGAFFGAALVGKWVGFYPVEAGITAGLCMANMGGTGDVAVLSASDRMELMPFAQISSRLGGAIILIIGSLLLSTLGALL